jgi:hypothetical protein
VEDPLIDILIPVLGRPQNAAPLVENIRSATQEAHTIWFLCSPDDNAQIEACVSSGADYVHVMDFKPGPADYARKINHGFVASGKVGSSEWVFMGADDLTFEKNWDWIALKAAGRKYDVIGTNDMANAQVRRGMFGTHCLIRRRYVTEQGGTAAGTGGDVLWEGYDHNFVDRELCHVAQHRRRFIASTHSKVRHRHPLWRTAPNDPTYVKALAKFRQDQRLFLSRAHLWGYVGLSAQERKLAA